MENIKRACALGGVPVVAPIDTRTTQSVPFMQMTDSQNSKNVPRNRDEVKISGFQFQGKIDYLDDCVTKIVEMFEKNNKRLIEEIKTSRDNRDSRDSRSSRDSSRRGYKSDSDSGSEDDRYRSRSRDDSRGRSRSRGRSGNPCTYCHKPKHDFSHCYKLARELRKLCTGEKRSKGDKEEEARLNMLSCVKNYFESEKDSLSAKGNPKFSCPSILSHSNSESLRACSKTDSREKLFVSSLKMSMSLSTLKFQWIFLMI